jgi:hypothetical protein
LLRLGVESRVSQGLGLWLRGRALSRQVQGMSLISMMDGNGYRRGKT